MGRSFCLLLWFWILQVTAVFGGGAIDDAIGKAKSDPSIENVIDLGRYLVGLAHYNSPPESSPDFLRVRDALLSIPNFSIYFAEEIRREQKEVEGVPTGTGNRVTYDHNRYRHFKTLEHLPSPETVAVLGDFLSDDIDTPGILRLPGSDWGDNMRANSYGAFATVMRIGLRNPPVVEKDGYDDPESGLEKTRVWWERIKSGDLAFSFVGQQEEYRFRSDGTWETIALIFPPDDTSKQVKRSVPTPISAEANQQFSRWWWIGGVCFLLGGFTWVFWRKLGRV